MSAHNYPCRGPPDPGETADHQTGNAHAEPDQSHGRESVTWNDTVISHPQLSSTDKLVYHLLDRLGGDSPQSRLRLAALLGLGQRQLRRSRERLQQHGFLGRSSMTAPAPEADIYDRTADIFDRQTVIHDRSLNAPTRTLWSSSSEEDVLTKASTPPPPPGGAGGESIPADFLVEMGSAWKTIAPQERDEPRDWFRTLHREFGPQVPLLVFQQFAQSQRTVEQLRHPRSYKGYFARCCCSARTQGLTLADPPVLRGFAASRDSRCQTDPPPAPADFEQDWLARCRAQNAAERQRFQREMERSRR